MELILIDIEEMTEQEVLDSLPKDGSIFYILKQKAMTPEIRDHVEEVAEMYGFKTHAVRLKKWFMLAVL